MTERNRSFGQVQLEYDFDRLSTSKMIQVYQLLMPEKVWPTSNGNAGIREESEHEAGSDLCPRILEETKRGTYDSESDGSAAGVCSE